MEYGNPERNLKSLRILAQIRRFLRKTALGKKKEDCVRTQDLVDFTS
jgi:hypothetical protein